MDDLAELVSGNVLAEEAVELCRALVRVPSENPPGDERGVADEVQRLLRGIGLSSERVEPSPGRVSVVSSWGDGDRTLLFNGHTDVVPATDLDAWPHPPYAGVVHDGRLYGRGASDMKAGIAACLAAVAGLQRAGLRPAGRLLMHLVADEEALGAHGTKHLVDTGWCDGVAEAVVGEPTSLHLVTSERGAFWARIVTHGLSAHGSAPQLGVNAIEHMAHVVLAVQGMRFRKLHEMLGAPTVNVGVVAGGTRPNMVPDRCEIEVDRRTLPGESIDEVRAQLDAVLDDVRSRVPAMRAEIAETGHADASETPDGTRMVGLLADARDALGAEGSELGYMGATDARFLINQARIPAVVFGPGDIRLAHTTGEHVEVAELVAGARIYAHAFARFLDAS